MVAPHERHFTRGHRVQQLLKRYPVSIISGTRLCRNNCGSSCRQVLTYEVDRGGIVAPVRAGMALILRVLDTIRHPYARAGEPLNTLLSIPGVTDACWIVFQAGP